jgi:TRAP-type C4-dicarboxylate transport system permease small subunit
MYSSLKPFFDILYKTCIWIAGLSILVMSLIIPVGIFTRYVLGAGSSWPEPVAILLMVTFTFFGAAASYRAGSHIAVEMIVSKLSKIPKRVMEIIVDLIMLALCLFLVFYGFKLSHEMMRQGIAQLPWLKVGITYSPIPISALITVFFILEKMIFGQVDFSGDPDTTTEVEEA